MPRRSNDFQRVIALINACLRESGTVRESALLVDTSNRQEREVDVLISSTIADYPVNIAVEVIDHRRKADSPWIEKMYAKHLHLPTDKLVLVSRAGFYKPALDKAKSFGIETMTFQEALKTDWDLATRMTSSGFLELTTITYRCSAEYHHGNVLKTTAPARKETTVFLPYRDAPTDFEKMAQFFIEEPRIKALMHERIKGLGERKFSMAYTPPPGTYVMSEDGTKDALTRVVFDLEVENSTTPISFCVGRYGRREVAYGKSSDPRIPLYYVLVRKQHDQIEGLLLDKAGIRSLKVTSPRTSGQSDDGTECR